MAEKGKPIQMGSTVETSWFTVDGGCGFQLNNYGGRFGIAFWEKGKGISDDGKISMNGSQTYTLLMNLKPILIGRQEEWSKSGPESYKDVNIDFRIGGVVNGEDKEFAMLNIKTVPVNGIKRIQISLTRNGKQSTAVLCDKGGCIKSGKSAVDECDGSFARFVSDIDGWVHGSWQFATTSKLFAAMSGGGNNNGGSSSPSYQRESDGGGGGTGLPW